MMKTIQPTIKMMMIKRYMIIIAFFNPLMLFAQNNDFGLWYGINLEKKINKKFDFNFNTTLRTSNNASQVGQYYLEGGISYKINKYLDAAAYYRWTYKHEEGTVFSPRHRWFTDVKLSYPLYRLKFSARFRYQNQYKNNYESDEDKIVEHYGRIKVYCLYNIPSFPINPYISLEYFYPLFNKSVTYADKKRFTLGAEYNISKKHAVSLEYIFQRDYLPQLEDIHIISLNYKFSF